MAVVNPPWVLQASAAHTAKLFRRILQGMLGEGVAGMNVSGVTSWPLGLSGDLAVSPHAPNNMSVDVAKGGGYIYGDDTSDQGIYFIYNDATVNVGIAASDLTNPRIDIIVARVKDNTEGQAGDTSTIEVIQGTPNASPSPPAVPNTAIKLAEVRVNASVTSITSGNITDARVMATDTLQTKPTPAVKVYRTGSFSYGTSLIAINWNAESYDTDDLHDLVTNNARLTIPNGLGGTYLVQGQADGSILTTQFQINKNGALACVGPPGDNPPFYVATVLQLNASDYVELMIKASIASQAIVVGESHSWFAMTKVG